MAQCRSCHADIVWAVSERGSRMPIDTEPNAAGNVTLTYGRPGEPPVARVLSGDARLAADPGTLHRAHFLTCPHANLYRKRKARSHRDTRR